MYPKISQCKYNYWRGDYRALESFFAQYDWDTILSDLSCEECEVKFLSIYNEGLAKFVPKLKCSNNVQTKPKWLNHESVMWINKKKMAWSRYRKRRTTFRYEAYCRVRNIVTNIIREVKRNYEKSIAKEAKKNPKAVYAYMRSKTKIKEEVLRLKNDDGTYTNDDMENCTLLNRKFLSVSTQEPPGELPRPDYTFDGPALENVTFTLAEVKDLLKNMKENSAPGPDSVASKVLKECRESLSLPIFILMKKSFDSSVLPKN